MNKLSIKEIKDRLKDVSTLDDPFVQLDENHLINVIDIIKEISKDIQIVYLTCHESRKI